MELKISLKEIRNFQPIPVVVKGPMNGMDETVYIKHGEVFWCPNKMTKSLLIYEKKNIISIEQSSIPHGLNLYETYPEDYINSLSENNKIEDGPVVDVNEPKKKIEDPDQLDISSKKIEEYKKSKSKKSNSTDNKGSTRWSDKEIKWLQKNYPKSDISAKDCADKLGRSEKSVRKKILSLGLKKL